MKNIKKILDLIRKTGDRYIFEDEQGEIFVILPVSDYENIVLKNSQVKSLSEEELLNKINKDVALWKAGQEEESINQDLPDPEVDSAEPVEDQEKVNEDRYYFEPVEDEE